MDRLAPREFDMRRGQTTSAEQVVLKLRQIAVQSAQGKDRVQRIWRREGLKVPQKHRPATALPRGECETGDGLRGRSRQRDFFTAESCFVTEYKADVSNDQAASRRYSIVSSALPDSVSLPRAGRKPVGGRHAIRPGRA
jgi:hypothetical protein